MDARERLLAAVGKAAHESYKAEGYFFFDEDDLARLGADVHASEHDARVVLRELESSWLVESDGGRLHKARGTLVPGLASRIPPRAIAVLSVPVGARKAFNQAT